MAQIFDTARIRLPTKHAIRIAVGRYVERDVAVESLHDAIGTDALIVRILRGTDNLEACTSICQVVHALVVANLPDVGLQSEFVVSERLADVQIVAAALDNERLDGKDALTPTKRRGRIVDDLLFRRLSLQSRDEQHRRGEQQRAKNLVPHDFLHRVQFTRAVAILAPVAPIAPVAPLAPIAPLALFAPMVSGGNPATSLSRPRAASTSGCFAPAARSASSAEI